MVAMLATAAVTVQAADRPRRTTLAEPVVITLREAVRVEPSDLRVGDVADVEGGHVALRRRIAQLDLDESPGENETLHVTREQIRYRILLADVPRERFQLAGAEEVAVELDRASVPAEEFIGVARSFLLQQFGERASQVRLRLARPIRGPISVAAPRQAIRLEAGRDSTRPPLGDVCVYVKVLAEDQPIHKVPVFWHVTLDDTVAVVTKPIEAGGAITESNVRFEQRRIQSPEEAATEAKELIGSRAKRRLSPLQLVSARDVKAAAAAPGAAGVKRGDTVTLRAQRSTLRVTTTGEVQQAAKVGEMVSVKNRTSGRIVRGRLMEGSVVDVAF